MSSLDAPPAAVAQPDATSGSVPGWYPEGGNTSVMRYWDGTTFVARRHWNGTAWIDS
jgi:hypothetical protein